jgi:hypothetical protein
LRIEIESKMSVFASAFAEGCQFIGVSLAVVRSLKLLKLMSHNDDLLGAHTHDPSLHQHPLNAVELQANAQQLNKQALDTLICWTVFAAFHVCTHTTDRLLRWIPFYYSFKGIACLLIMFPLTKIANLLFVDVLVPGVCVCVRRLGLEQYKSFAEFFVCVPFLLIEVLFPALPSKYVLSAQIQTHTQSGTDEVQADTAHTQSEDDPYAPRFYTDDTQEADNNLIDLTQLVHAHSNTEISEEDMLEEAMTVYTRHIVPGQFSHHTPTVRTHSPRASTSIQSHSQRAFSDKTIDSSDNNAEEDVDVCEQTHMMEPHALSFVTPVKPAKPTHTLTNAQSNRHTLPPIAAADTPSGGLHTNNTRTPVVSFSVYKQTKNSNSNEDDELNGSTFAYTPGDAVITRKNTNNKNSEQQSVNALPDIHKNAYDYEPMDDIIDADDGMITASRSVTDSAILRRGSSSSQSHTQTPSTGKHTTSSAHHYTTDDRILETNRRLSSFHDKLKNSRSSLLDTTFSLLQSRRTSTQPNTQQTNTQASSSSSGASARSASRGTNSSSRLSASTAAGYSSSEMQFDTSSNRSAAGSIVNTLRGGGGSGRRVVDSVLAARTQSQSQSLSPTDANTTPNITRLSLRSRDSSIVKGLQQQRGSDSPVSPPTGLSSSRLYEQTSSSSARSQVTSVRLSTSSSAQLPPIPSSAASSLSSSSARGTPPKEDVSGSNSSSNSSGSSQRKSVRSSRTSLSGQNVLQQHEVIDVVH